VAGDGRPDEPPVPIPGATVVPLRDGPGGLEVLMIERAAAIAYGGMWAFPGGRVDPGDRPDADEAGGGDAAAGDAAGGRGHDIARARRAAVREAEEEVGLRFAAGDLVTTSHWTGGADPRRRYAAWYFLGPAPEGDVVLDEAESAAHRWIRPADAIVLRDRGEIGVVAPTWITLHSLTAASTVAEALTSARRRPPEVYRSRVVEAGDERIVLWHGDAGYEAGDPSLAGPRHRLVMATSGWQFESSSAGAATSGGHPRAAGRDA
jgi:8-oxo-dGTP pyrophosphatase MutT (NUDIX family)